MMIKFFAFAVLLTGCFILTECRLSDPASELESIVSHITHYYDEITNLLALKELRSATNLSPKAEKLRKSILSIPVEDNQKVCEGTTLKKLNDLNQVFSARSEEDLILPRMDSLVKALIRRAYGTCVRSFEKEFSDTAGHLPEQHHPLEQLIQLYRPHHSYKMGQIHDDYPLKELHAAVKHAKSTSFPDRSTLRSMMDELYCRAESAPVDPRPCGLKINEKTGGQDDLTPKEAKEHLDKLLLEPCKSIFGNEKVQNVLKKVVDLSEAMIRHKELQYNGNEDEKLMKWAAMGVTCKWIERNKDKLLKRLVSGVNRFIDNAKLGSLLGPDQNKEPVFLLNSYLVDNLKSEWNINRNIEAVQNLQSQTVDPDCALAASTKLIESVSKLKLIGDDDFCGGENLKNLRTTMETVVGDKEESFKTPLDRRRLNFILKSYTNEALSKCLESQFVTAFSQTTQNLPHKEGLQRQLEPFFRIVVKKPKLKHIRSTLSDSVHDLIGAENLPEGEYKSWTSSFKRKLESKFQPYYYGGMEDDLDSIPELMSDISSPCESLRHNDVVKKIFGQVVDLSVAIGYAGLSRELSRETSSTIEWAPIFVVCKWLHDSGTLEEMKIQKNPAYNHM